MISFESDYITGAHPEILKRFMETNLEAESGYGNDRYSASAKEKIRAACGCPEAEVEFLVGGTQTNSLVISSLLKEYEGVIAAKTGHVSLHEAGAIEYTGHKVVEIPGKDGKLNAEDVDKTITDMLADGNIEHMVFPGMVYISFPTEYGTLYSKAELTAISAVCRKHNIPLFIDGARLGYGLMSLKNDVTLPELCELCDVFYIGGTKVGALCGEAVVYTKKNRPAHFEGIKKRRGALLAKGRLAGIQFDTLFTDDLYFKISKNAIDQVEKMKQAFEEKGYRFFLDSPTNQQFIILENKQMEELKKKVCFAFFEKFDDAHTVVRFATCWSTTDEDIEALKAAL